MNDERYLQLLAKLLDAQMALEDAERRVVEYREQYYNMLDFMSNIRKRIKEHNETCQTGGL